MSGGPRGAVHNGAKGAPAWVLSQFFVCRQCEASQTLSVGKLGGQGVELFGRSEAFVSGLDHPLSFLDHVHEFHTS